MNPRVIVEELRASSAWRLQGTAIVQDVASDDGRFVLNFSVEGDRRFVLKAQPWHNKRDGVIFAEFDGKGNPAEFDLGVMPIWVQVRDLPFELKTESMGWTFGEQLGDVSAVSHRDHLIVEKYLRLRVEIPLHEPLKTTVEFTPLGSSESFKYDVRYEKLPLYCECCGIVGHTSERYCSIPKDKRVASFPKNLSVEAYWKGIGASKRTLLFAGSNSNNFSRAAEKSVVKVTKAMADLTVTEKLTTTTTTTAAAAIGGPIQESFPLGQDGRVNGAPTPAHPGAGTGQEDLPTPPRSSANSDQAGQGKAAGDCSSHGAKHGQEGHVLERVGTTSSTPALLYAAGRMQGTAVQGGQGFTPPDATTFSAAAAGSNNLQDLFLFKPGVLGALSGAVAARLAVQATANDTGVFTFAAHKIPMQGQKKKKERKGRKKGGNEKSESDRNQIIGKKRSNPFGVPPTGSDLKFSFERERWIAMNVCCCMARRVFPLRELYG